MPAKVPFVIKQNQQFTKQAIIQDLSHQQVQELDA
jgi:hypothetical protein